MLGSQQLSAVNIEDGMLYKTHIRNKISYFWDIILESPVCNYFNSESAEPLLCASALFWVRYLDFIVPGPSHSQATLLFL